MFERFDLALRHQRAELQGKAGAGKHFVNRRGQGHGQAKPADILAGGHANPAAFRDGVIALGETG